MLNRKSLPRCFCAAALALALQPATASPEEMVEALRLYFRPLGLLPVVVPSDYQPGAVYDLRSMLLVDRAATCFKNLTVTSRKVELPAGAAQSGWFGRLAARAADVVGLSVSASGSGSYSVKLTDAVITEVAVGDLRTALQPQCERLRSLLNGAPTSGTMEAPLARVLNARVSIFVSGASEATAGASASDLGRLASMMVGKPIKLNAEAAASAGWSRVDGWALQSTQVLPIAYQLALLPRRNLGAVETFSLLPFNPDDDLNQAAFGDLSDGLSPLLRRQVR